MLIKLTRSANNTRSFGGALLLSPFAKILSVTLFTALLGSAGFGGYKMWQNKNLELDLIKAQNELITTSSRLNECKNEMSDQSERIKNIAAEAAADVEIIKRVNEQLDTANKIQEKEIGRLRSKPAPKSCEESKDWLRDNLDIFEDAT